MARRVPGRDAAGGLEPDQRPAPAHVPAGARRAGCGRASAWPRSTARSSQWRHLARWLEDRGIRSLADCNAGVLHDYGQHAPRRGPQQEARPTETLVSLTRLWAFDQLSARPSGIGRPPWEDLGIDDYLPAATAGGGENTTEPLAEQTIGPLLIWAMRMVDDLSGDILAAWAERQRLTRAARASTATPAGQAALEAYLRPLIASQAPLPATIRQRQDRASPAPTSAASPARHAARSSRFTPCARD